LHNNLLDALPRDLYRSLERTMERLMLKRGVVLHRPGRPIRHLYFPLTCLVSITITMKEGKTVECGVAGSREMAGVNAFMGGWETTQTLYQVQVPGYAVKMPAGPLLEAFDQHKAVRDVLLKYTQAHIAQISQNAACNRVHDLTQRYARWLLEVRDRLQSDDIRLTREFASEMLGVRRATVSGTSAMFQKRGVTSVRRGLTHIEDRRALERLACECYGVLKEENDRLLGVAGKHRPLRTVADRRSR